MKRAILEFVGFASSAVWAMLVLGTVLTGVARAGPEPVSNNCLECYSCVQEGDPCDYSGAGNGCTDTHTCICVKPNYVKICKKK